MINGPEITSRISVKLFFRWYDLWIGAYIDAKAPAIYVCPLPTVGIKIWREKIATCGLCRNRAEKTAIDTGDGWLLCWHCPLGCMDEEDGLLGKEDWPIPEGAYVSAEELERQGFKIW